MRINSKEELLNKKAEIEQLINGFTCRVLVCSGTGCMASGAQKIYAETFLEKGMYDMVGTDLHNLETFGKWIGNVRLTDKLAREIMSLR